MRRSNTRNGLSKLRRSMCDAHMTLGPVLGRLGRPAGGHGAARASAANRIPIPPQAHYNFGVALMEMGKVPEAAEHLRAGATDQTRFRRGPRQSRGGLGEAGQACRCHRDITKRHCGSIPITPRRTTTWGSPCVRRAGSGGHHALRAGAADQARLRRGALQSGDRLGASGKVEEAIAHYEQALRIKPDYAEAHNNLGIALAQAGRIEEAIAHFEQALRIKPDYAEAHCNLGNVFLQKGRSAMPLPIMNRRCGQTR